MISSIGDVVGSELSRLHSIHNKTDFLLYVQANLIKVILVFYSNLNITIITS